MDESIIKSWQAIVALIGSVLVGVGLLWKNSLAGLTANTNFVESEIKRVTAERDKAEAENATLKSDKEKLRHQVYQLGGEPIV